MEVTRQKRDAKMLMREDAKKAHLSLEESKKAFDIAWSTKQCVDEDEIYTWYIHWPVLWPCSSFVQAQHESCNEPEKNKEYGSIVGT